MPLALLLASWWDLPELRKSVAGEAIAYEARAAGRAIAVFDGFAVRFDLTSWKPADGDWRRLSRYPHIRGAAGAVLFWTDRAPSLGSVSFPVTGSGWVKFLLIGLGPGTWELWRNGWLAWSSGGG